MVCNTQALLALKIPGGLNQPQKLGLFFPTVSLAAHRAPTNQVALAPVCTQLCSPAE